MNPHSILLAIALVVVFSEDSQVAQAQTLVINDIEARALCDSFALHSDSSIGVLGLTFNSHDYPIDFSGLLKFSRLREVDIGGINEGDVDPLIDALLKMPCVRHLGMRSQNIQFLTPRLALVSTLVSVRLNSEELGHFPDFLVQMPSIQKVAIAGKVGSRIEYFPASDSLYPIIIDPYRHFADSVGKRVFRDHHLRVFTDSISILGMDAPIDSASSMLPVEVEVPLRESKRLRQIVGTIVASPTLADQETSLESPKYSFDAYFDGRRSAVRMYSGGRIEVNNRKLKPSLLLQRFEAELGMFRRGCE